MSIAVQNRAAYLIEAGKPLEVRDAPMPIAGPGEVVVKNAAVAINPLDWHMLDHGVFVQQWPAIFGCDVAGTVQAVGADVTRFKEGDRVIGHTINLISGRPEDGAFQLYTVLSVDKTAILPDSIPFTDGVVVPFALEAATCALFVKEPGIAMPGVNTPALGLPYPSLDDSTRSIGKTLVVLGGSSSAGSMTTQVAAAGGIHVIAIAGARSTELCKDSGASQVFDRNDPLLVQHVVEAVQHSGNEFVGIFDSIAVKETLDVDLAILEKLGGGNLALTHPPVSEVPGNVKAGMIFAVNDVATPVWMDFVTPALQSGKIKCLPRPTIVGNGLEYIQEALLKSKNGVSGTKLVVTL